MALGELISIKINSAIANAVKPSKKASQRRRERQPNQDQHYGAFVVIISAWQNDTGLHF